MPSGAGDQFNLSEALVPDSLLRASTPCNNCWADFLSHNKQISAPFLEALAATFSCAGESCEYPCHEPCGRACLCLEKSGICTIKSSHPPFTPTLKSSGYQCFPEASLEERRDSGAPCLASCSPLLLGGVQTHWAKPPHEWQRPYG